MDNTNITPDNALDEMMRANNELIETSTESIGNDNLPVDTTSEAQAPTVSTSEMLRVFQDINQLMGEFLNSLTPLDQQFTNIANNFFATANRLADKENLSEEEMMEAVTNGVTGGLVQGVGNLINAFRTQQAIQKVKSILYQEATAKMDIVNALVEEMPLVRNAAWDNFSNAFDHDSTFEITTTAFNDLRTTLYMEDLLTYLQATYNEALNGNFQNWVSYPSLYVENQFLLYKVLTDTENGDSEATTLINRRKSIDSLIQNAISYMSNSHAPDSRTYIFASDPQIMGVAIHDYYPMPEISEYAEVEESGLMPISIKHYELFESLYGTAHDHEKDSSLASYVLYNDALLDTLHHYFSIKSMVDRYDSRMGWYVANIILIAILAFLAAFIKFDLAWYWSLLIGIGAGIIGAWATPFSALEELFHKKITYGERTIQLNNRTIAGYTDPINLAELESKNNKVWLWGLLGAIAGFCFIPIPGGLIIGAILGFWLGKSNKDTDEVTDYNYENISEGSTWKAKTLTFLLAAGCIYYIVVWILDYLNK